MFYDSYSNQASYISLLCDSYKNVMLKPACLLPDGYYILCVNLSNLASLCLSAIAVLMENELVL